MNGVKPFVRVYVSVHDLSFKKEITKIPNEHLIIIISYIAY